VDYPDKFNNVFFNKNTNPVISYFDPKGIFLQPESFFNPLIPAGEAKSSTFFIAFITSLRTL